MKISVGTIVSLWAVISLIVDGVLFYWIAWSVWMNAHPGSDDTLATQKFYVYGLVLGLAALVQGGVFVLIYWRFMRRR